MKFLVLPILALPMVSASTFWTNSGWAKPATFNSPACANNPNAQYFCGAVAGTKGENQEPNAFPIRRDTCTIADTLGRACNWQGAC
ncbi:hypothetical protein F53441_13717 [Fusarium austroafricanum]|uniref:Uncharacterized protein n=1 Tax=Fusarium austroafricanum TaxID=2364996 RepID=A0A8H4JNX9_9HYPO|nr:hypothetical protein F53441_13717 [Fusarium austroafricanum]